MNAILEAAPAAISVRMAFDAKSDRPRPEWVRGTCPQCGDELVSNCYHVGGQGYLVIWDCWSAISSNPTCTYRTVI